MREPNINQNWTIFTSLHEALKGKELKRLRLAKCKECGRFITRICPHISGIDHAAHRSRIRGNTKPYSLNRSS